MSEMTCTLKMLNIADALVPARSAHDSTAPALPDEHYNILGSTTPGGLRRFNSSSDSGVFAVSERPWQLSSQFATAAAALPTDESRSPDSWVP
jgi:hypothetical protein